MQWLLADVNTYLLQWIAASGAGIYYYVSPVLAYASLGVVTGSVYWQERWVQHEKNMTNKQFIRQFLQADEAVLLSCLQKDSVINCSKFTTKWEYLRLFAVMEKANNGSKFARALLWDAASTTLLLRLGLEEGMQALLEKIHHLSDWSLRRNQDIIRDHQECMPIKYTS